MLFDSQSVWILFVLSIFPLARGRLGRNMKGQLWLERECRCLVFGKLQVSKFGGIILGRAGKGR